jgi:primosomal protein N' (replication factor Y) (superfamily II helicase)
MYIHVKLLNGFKEPLLYAVPPEWDTEKLVGTFVKVPLKERLETGVVVCAYAEKPAECTFSVRAAHTREPFPADVHYTSFIQTVSHYYRIEPFYFMQRVRQFLAQKEVREVDHAENTPIQGSFPQLTDEQQRVVDFVAEHITTPHYVPTLLHGVTGSGKTEVYKRLIMHAYAHKKSTILTLPEVTLALQFERMLQEQLGNELAVVGFHSATTPKEKQKVWSMLLAGTPLLLIGVHLPIALPIAQLGLIIIDEEHDVGYQEKKHPKLNTKEMALFRAQQYGIPILLGSATPSMSSLYNTEKKQWHFFQLKKRFQGNFPAIQTVLLTDKHKRKNFWISQPLYDAIAEQLHRQEQTIIFLNRRGFSFFVQCKQCSFIFSCQACSVSLTLHGQHLLACHYCGFSSALPTTCSECKADEKEFLKKGIGTQQVVSILQDLFPQARIGRADLDTVSKKKQWHETVRSFQEGTLDILVGTQTITKGYHFPRVTLVGVIWADVNLHFPIYNATEVALQQLIQVAGRAGRVCQKSTVIVQTMVEHPVLEFIDELKYLDFYIQEIASRAQLSYPPYARFAEIELKHSNQSCLEHEANDLAHSLRAIALQLKLPITVLGPAQPLVYKIKQYYLKKIYIKSTHITAVLTLFRSIEKDAYTSSIGITQNPLQ